MSYHRAFSGQTVYSNHNVCWHTFIEQIRMQLFLGTIFFHTIMPINLIKPEMIEGPDAASAIRMVNIQWIVTMLMLSKKITLDCCCTML